MPLLLAFADYELDEAKFELRRAGERVEVQPRVLELILYVARHRERVVGKDELFTQVWDGTAVTEASLSQAVRSARTALGDSSREQRVLRTVRGRGLRFVAEEAARTPTKPPRAPAMPIGDTAMDTHDAPGAPLSRAADALLIAVVHGDAPRLGGASYSLAGVDEVLLGRGSRRRREEDRGLTSLLRISMPDQRASRRHAHLVRTPNGWVLVDDDSRNGTRVNGERVTKRPLVSGDRIQCGATIWLFLETVTAPPDVETGGEQESLLSTLSPPLRLVEEQLLRIAPTPLPVLLIGDIGVGKTHTAMGIHRLSERTTVQRIDLAGVKDEGPLSVDGPQAGTLLLEGLDQLEPALAPAVVALLDEVPEARVIATSRAGLDELEARLPRDLSSRVAGYRATLPPLSERLADLGTLLARLLPEPPAMRAEVVEAAWLHPWPGNLRELAMVFQVAAVVAEGAPLTLDHLPPELRQRASAESR